MFLKINVLLALVGLSLCATWQAFLPEIPEKFAGQEGCYIKETDEVVDFGVTIAPIGHCYRIGCGQNTLSYASCGIAIPAPPCYVTEQDLTKPYPDCCPRIVCPPVDDVSENHI